MDRCIQYNTSANSKSTKNSYIRPSRGDDGAMCAVAQLMKARAQVSSNGNVHPPASQQQMELQSHLEEVYISYRL